MTGMTPNDIGLITQAVDLRVSPDGGRLAFTVVSVDLDANTYRSRIWMVPSDGSSPAYPFTAGEGRDGLPRWSPDGRRMAFTTQEDRSARDRGGSTASTVEIVIMPVTVGGQPVRVAAWDDDISELEWSPDGNRLAFVARDRDQSRYGTRDKPIPESDMPPRRIDRLLFREDTVGWTVDRPNRIFVAMADGSRPARALTSGPFEASDLSWAPDGNHLAFVSARHERWDLDLANDVWRISLDGDGQPHRLTDTTAQFRHPVWSVDGQRLACLRTPTPLDEPRHTRVAVLEVASGDLVEISGSLDRTCAPFGAIRPPQWDGDGVLFTAEDAGNVHLYRAAVDNRARPDRLLGGERTITSWDCAGGTLAFVATTAVTLGDVFVGMSGQRLTSFSETFIGELELARPERYVAQSSDGAEVECWAMAPIGAEAGHRYPTLLNIHGGPFTQYGNRFFDEFQIQAGAGFGVVYCNPRGSSGYSEAWGRAIRWPEANVDPGSGWGGVDFEDVMACVAEAERRYPWIDPDRLGVLGGSYGGYLTSWIIGHSDRFRAACSERSCNDLLSLEQTSDIASSFRAVVGKTHLEAPEIYLRQSPISYVEHMTTPVLILHSEEDLRCPISQAEELFVALRMLGRDPVMIRFPAESHELSRSGSPRHRVMRAELILDWFRRQLA